MKPQLTEYHFCRAKCTLRIGSLLLYRWRHIVGVGPDLRRTSTSKNVVKKDITARRAKDISRLVSG